LLVHVFIGSRLALLAEEGEKMSAGDKAINYLSMLIGGVVGLVVSVLIYNRTMARAAEIALEQAATGEGDGADYADVEAGLMDPDTAAALMEDDDISLWGGGDYDSSYTDDDNAAQSNGSATLSGRSSPGAGTK
jgi:hypothetical protein